MFGIEKDFQKLMEQVYGPHYGLGRKVEEESARIAKQLADNAVEEAKKMDEPVQYETPMTEIEELKAQIKVLEKKLALLEEPEKTKSPVEEAFKRVYGYYPEGCEKMFWVAFQTGYEESQKDYKIEEPVKTKSLYQFLAEWKYGIEEGDKIPQFDNDEFDVLDWSQIFIDYLYEEGDIIFENEDEIIVKFKQTQLGIPNE